MTIPLRRSPCRGNAIVEFAIAFGLLLTIFAGVWQFGYAFYAYNQLESAVRNAARYASVAVYDGGTWDGATLKTRAKNMVVYGTPTPTGSDKALLPGLETSHVRVIPTFAGMVPERIEVDINGYLIDAFFTEFPLNGKPSSSFQYMGRFIVP